MITKFKIFETVDRIETPQGEEIWLHRNNVYPFVIKLNKNEIHVGDEGDVHTNLYHYGSAYKEDTDIQGRIYKQEKTITFWGLDKIIKKNILKKLFKIIAKEFNIQDYNGWVVDVATKKEDIDKYEQKGYYIYLGYDGNYYTLIPINDLISGIYNIENDSDTHALHLLNSDEKRKELIRKGYTYKNSKWKKWQKPFENKIL